MDELGQSPEVAAKQAVDEAYEAVLASSRGFRKMASTRLGYGAVTPLADTAADAGVAQIIELLATDALSVVIPSVIGKKDRHGNVKKTVTGKVEFDEARFAFLHTDLDTSLKARGTKAPNPNSETPAKDEFVRIQARAQSYLKPGKAPDPKKRAKWLKEVSAMAAQKGAESALKKDPTVLGEAGKHRAAIHQAAAQAGGEHFSLQHDFNATAFDRDIETARLLKRAFAANGNRRDLIDSARRLKVRAEDRGSPRGARRHRGGGRGTRTRGRQGRGRGERQGSLEEPSPHPHQG
jgi:hypothetical protein